MTKIINKKDRKLGFDSDEFQLVIKKPGNDSVWFEVTLKAGKHQFDSLWRGTEVPEMMAKRLEKTLELFMNSSYKTITLTGKVMNDEEEME